MFLSKKLNMGAGTPAPTIDSQFNNVTMLLHGDGTNGAQNNTFLDSSTNNFTITRNGNTTQGSFSPYGSNWSTFFDGTQDNLYTPSTSALNVGSGNFTFECFFNVSVFNGGNILRGANQYSACALLLSGTGVIYYISSTGSNWDIASGQTAISSGLSVGVWYHLALVRNGNVVTPYVNGVAGTTTTTSATFSALNGFNIGAEQNGVAGGSFNGFISNVRVVVGTAVYTSNFTPPTANLTAISGTQLLACQNNRFIDNSSNNFSFTTAGTPSVQRFNPFGTSTAYSTSVIGGSGYFDGTDDWLTMPSNSAFDLGTGDFTVECWVYRNTSTSGYETMLGFDVTGGLLFEIYQNELDFGIRGTANVLGSGVTVPSLQWVHLAITRQSGVVRYFQNGTLTYTYTGTYATQNFTNNGTAIISGYGTPGGQLNGYISNLRLVKGTALYTSSFTPSTTPLTAVSGTSLLANFTNGAIFDNAMMNDLETVGNAQISTSVVKYGTGSMYFDGTADYLVSAPSPNNILGSGDFTIEFWLYPSNTSGGYRALVSSENYAAISDGWSLYQFGTSIEFWISSGNIINAASAISATNWQHLALCRASGTLRLFINGTSVISVSNSTSLTGQQIWIGDNNNGSYFYDGYIDDLRITKGFARYTANFTPPSAAFPNTGPY